MHGDVFGQLGVAASHGHDHTDAITMQVLTNVITGSQRLKTAHVDILAQLGDETSAAFIEGFAFTYAQQRFHAVSLAVDHSLGSVLAQSLQFVILGDEVGFAVDFDDAGGVTSGGHADKAFGRYAAGFLVGLGLAVLAHLFDRGFDVAICRLQRAFAVHHRGARALAQFLDLCSSNCHVVCRLDWE